MQLLIIIICRRWRFFFFLQVVLLFMPSNVICGWIFLLASCYSFSFCLNFVVMETKTCEYVASWKGQKFIPLEIKLRHFLQKKSHPSANSITVFKIFKIISSIRSSHFWFNICLKIKIKVRNFFSEKRIQTRYHYVVKIDFSYTCHSTGKL